MDTAPADISYFFLRRPGKFAFDGGGPVPGHRYFENRILDRHREWELPGGGAGGQVGRAVDHQLLRLEWRVAAERRIAVDRGPVREGPEAGSQRCFISWRVSKTQARLKDQVMRLRE